MVHASSKPPSSCRNWATCSMNCSSFCAVMSVISSRPFHGQLLIAAKRIDNVDIVDGSEVRAMLNQVLQVLDLVQVMLNIDQTGFRAIMNRRNPAREQDRKRTRLNSSH